MINSTRKTSKHAPERFGCAVAIGMAAGGSSGFVVEILRAREAAASSSSLSEGGSTKREKRKERENERARARERERHGSWCSGT